MTTASASKSLLSISCECPKHLWSHVHHLLFRSVPAIGNSAQSFAAHRYCESGQDLTVDHVKPVSKGGLWEWSNLVTACNKCNGKKGSKTLKQLGWKLKKIPSVSKLALCVFASQYSRLILPTISAYTSIGCMVQAPSAWQVGVLVGMERDVDNSPKVLAWHDCRLMVQAQKCSCQQTRHSLCQQP